MFYIQKNIKIDVAWVYNINPPEGLTLDSNLFFDNCYYPHVGHAKHTCEIYNKAPKNEKCTFLDPTNFNASSAYESNITVSTKTIPISVHIHGL